MQFHLSWSQSYPTQRVEGTDTVVVMTKQQADDINLVFRKNNIEISNLRLALDSAKLSIDTLSVQRDSISKAYYNYRVKVSQTADKIIEDQIIYERKRRQEAFIVYLFLTAYVSIIHFF